jgi:flagellar basal body-associated protein FliL
MYYYRRKTSPIKWLIIIIIILAVAAAVYWFYINYFSKIDFSKPQQEVVANEPVINEQKELAITITDFQGEVNVAVDDNDIQPAQKEMLLKQGDNITTNNNSQAILVLDDITIRLNQNSEIYFEKITDKEIIITQIKGRSYHNLSAGINYQVKFLNTVITPLSTKFEVITNNDQQFLAVLAFSGILNVAVNDDQGMIIASRIESGEKALVATQAAKNKLITIEDFSQEALLKEDWYQWNFDLDKTGINMIAEPEEEDEEPDFMVTDENLELATEKKETGIFLSWSVYDGDDFKTYQLIRSEKNQDLKYPDDPVIKFSQLKSFNSYLDSKIEQGKVYYYRVCVSKENDNVVCGNISRIETEVPEEDVVDTEPPRSPDLLATISVDGVALTWTANTEEDFKEYKILKSITNFLPAYPSEIIAVKFKEVINYLDTEVNITSVGRYYYRVCSLDINENYACSNVKIIENGQVQ